VGQGPLNEIFPKESMFRFEKEPSVFDICPLFMKTHDEQLLLMPPTFVRDQL
jgi:hypothetical protein